MKDKIELNNERETVDDFIITALITLIAAFIIILSIKRSTNEYIAYSSIASLFCLIVSLLFCLWHRFRFPYRLSIFLREEDKKLSDISGDIADFLENYMAPAIKSKVQDLLIKNPNLTKDELESIFSSEETNEEKGMVKKVIITHLKLLNLEVKELNEKIFNKPLDEKGRKIKFLLDRLARTLRYPLFVSGIIFLFLSIMLNLL